jgi:hypothetical protein
VLAFFEICPHPLHSSTRCRSAILLVDALVQSLSLTCIDAGDQRTSIFPAGQVASLPLSDSSKDPIISSCGCLALSTRRGHPMVSEIRKEEIRRMVWAAHNAFTVYTSKEVEFNQNFLPLFLTNPFNVSIPSSIAPILRCSAHDFWPVCSSIRSCSLARLSYSRHYLKTNCLQRSRFERCTAGSCSYGVAVSICDMRHAMAFMKTPIQMTK